MSDEVGELRNSQDALSDAEELRRRLRRDGYIFLRGLLAREDVVELRRALLEVCQRHGWLSAGSQLLDARVSRPPTQEGSAEFMPVYVEIQKMEAFHRFAHQAALIDPIARLLDEPVFVHPMKIARISFPNNVQQTTPSHQDYVHIQGSFETYTSWIPLGDVPRSLGGLAILAGSHKLGILQPRAAYGAGGLGLDVDSLGLPWHGTDYRAGDVLLFPSTAIHKALPNLSQDRLRLSVDYRYTGVTHAVGEGSLKPHYHWQVPELTYENIYRDWKSEDLKFYWKKLPLHVVPLTDAWAKMARGDDKR
ncbi:MAG TPA: phytanoyl-CoA dioxygenase family protein [Spirochaetia bacterium]|nr:phytanoyl-CoA dioxygenase family protein [Spirochaetia bacterium]